MGLYSRLTICKQVNTLSKKWFVILYNVFKALQVDYWWAALIKNWTEQNIYFITTYTYSILSQNKRNTNVSLSRRWSKNDGNGNRERISLRKRKKRREWALTQGINVHYKYHYNKNYILLVVLLVKKAFPMYSC